MRSITRSSAAGVGIDRPRQVVPMLFTALCPTADQRTAVIDVCIKAHNDAPELDLDGELTIACQPVSIWE